MQRYHGHYWCLRCDEPAFGDVCRTCHETAQFVPDAPERGEPARQAHRAARTHQFAPVDTVRAQQLFAGLRQQLNHD